MKAPFIETVTSGLEPIALIIRTEYDEPGIQFFTPANFSQQVAFMRHPPGHKIAAHVHNLQLRQVLYTQEVLFIRRGRVTVNLYSSDRKPICSRILNSGISFCFVEADTPSKLMEETSMIEVKQGPYAGDGDKTRFDDPEPMP